MSKSFFKCSLTYDVDVIKEAELNCKGRQLQHQAVYSAQMLKLSCSSFSKKLIQDNSEWLSTQ